MSLIFIQEIVAKQIFTSEESIEGFSCEFPKIVISTTKFYFIYDEMTKTQVKVGSTEKKNKFGFIFFREEEQNDELILLAGRPNGLMWKAKVDTGQVLSTLKFVSSDASKIRYSNEIGNLCKILQLIINIDVESIYILNMKTKEIQAHYPGIHIEQFCQYDNIIVGIDFQKQILYFFQLLKVSTLFNKVCERKQSTEILKLFKQFPELQNLENTKRLGQFVPFNLINQDQELKNIIKKIYLDNSKFCMVYNQSEKKNIELKISLISNKKIDENNFQTKLQVIDSKELNISHIERNENQKLSAKEIQSKCEQTKIQIVQLYKQKKIMSYLKKHVDICLKKMNKEIPKNVSLIQIISKLNIDEIKFIILSQDDQELLKDSDVSQLFIKQLALEYSKFSFTKEINFIYFYLKTQQKQKLQEEFSKVSYLERKYSGIFVSKTAKMYFAKIQSLIQ